MIENNFNYTITVTYVDNINESFNPSIIGSFLIDRQYLTNSAFWRDELKEIIAKEFNRTHCLPVMVKVYNADMNTTKEYVVFQNINNKLQFSSLNNSHDIF